MMRVDVYVYIHIYIYIYIFMSAYVYACVSIRLYIYIYIYTGSTLTLSSRLMLVAGSASCGAKGDNCARIANLSYSLNSLKRDSVGGYIGDYYWGYLEDITSLDFGSSSIVRQAALLLPIFRLVSEHYTIM